MNAHIIPGVERVQALADISRSALCCHSNETHTPNPNLLNSRPARVQGTPYHSPNLHPGPGPCSSVGTGNAARDRETHRWPWPLYISPRLRLTWNVTSPIGIDGRYLRCFRWNVVNTSQLVSQLEFNVPFQHKYGYIRDKRSGMESYPYPVKEG